MPVSRGLRARVLLSGAVAPVRKRPSQERLRPRRGPPRFALRARVFRSLASSRTLRSETSGYPLTTPTALFLFSPEV